MTTAFTGKYANVLIPFVTRMEKELHANAGKGDRPGWLQMDRKTGLLEIFWHMFKLQKAVKEDDKEGIREYAADVANMSMMLVDVCGALELQESANVPPIDMVLFCPMCGVQHIDKPKPCGYTECDHAGMCFCSAHGRPEYCERWDNPPHRSHLCNACGCIWRPADIPTNGVAAIQTRGTKDNFEVKRTIETCNRNCDCVGPCKMGLES